MSTPKITPIQLKEYNCKQSKYNYVVPKLQMRSTLCGPSSSGKTVLLSNMTLGIYRDCFSSIHKWSPSINVDSTWRLVKDCIRDHIKPGDREKCYFDSYEPSELEQIIKTQQKVIDYQKEQKHKDLHQILILVYDFVDGPSYTKITIITSVIN